MAKKQAKKVVEDIDIQQINYSFKISRKFKLTKKQMEFINAAKGESKILMIDGLWGTGKAQPLDSIVYTPRGGVRMGDLKVGDMVCTPDGKAAKVSGIFPQGKKEVYRVTFGDGANCLCCGEHLWSTYTHDEDLLRDSYGLKRVPSIKSTKMIAASLVSRKREGYNHYIPMHKPAYFSGVELGYSPRVLGEFYACARISGGYFYIENDEYFEEKMGGYLERYIISPPDEIKLASVEDRRAFLEGFIAASEDVNKFEHPNFEVVRLIKWVVNSLGGMVEFVDGGFKIKMGGGYGLEDDEEKLVRTIVGVEKVGERECQCIMIESRDHLYLTDDFITTHNTSMAIYYALEGIKEGRFDSLLYIRNPVEASNSSKIGFLPGSLEEKMSPYASPCYELLEEYLGMQTGDFVKNYVDVNAVSFTRGSNWENKIVVVDEAENLTREDLLLVMSRIKDGSKLLIVGDTFQADIRNSGFRAMFELFSEKEDRENGIYTFEFRDKDDIVRSGVLKYIMSKILR